LEVTNTWNDLVKMVGERDARGVLRFMVGSWAMESMMEEVFGLDVLPDVIGTVIDTVQKSLKNRNNPEDDDEDKESIIGSAIREALGQIVSMIPGNSLIAQLVFGINSDTGEKLFGEGNPSRYELGLGGVKDITQFGSDLAQVATGNKELRDVDLFTPLVEALLPFGGRQLTRSYKAAQDLGWMPYDTWGNLPFAGGERHEIPGAYSSKGDLKFELPDGVENAHDLTEIMKAMLFGEYATDAGKEYLDRGRKNEASASAMELANNYGDPKAFLDVWNNMSGTLSQARFADALARTDIPEELKADMWEYVSAMKGWKKSFEDVYSPKKSIDFGGKEDYLHGTGMSLTDQYAAWNKEPTAEVKAKADAYAAKGYSADDYMVFNTVADSNGSGTVSQDEARAYFQSGDMPDDEVAAMWSTLVKSEARQQAARDYAAAGYDETDYWMFDMLANTNGGTMSQKEAKDYLNDADLDEVQKRLIWELTFPGKKNPY